MNKKNIFKLISIILIVVGLFLITIVFIGKKDKSDDEKTNENSGIEVKPVTPDDEYNQGPISYDEAYNMAVSLYGGDNVNIELVDEADRYVIKRIYKKTEIIEIYYIDKETGTISAGDNSEEHSITG